QSPASKTILPRNKTLQARKICPKFIWKFLYFFQFLPFSQTEILRKKKTNRKFGRSETGS
ncbi:hypothetical protein, partial [Streptococcus sobrinus]|uniref:hypothetical protein n=1 Tax=Streptococcus sobrinus TaxID=1310 RepID=UPI001C3F50F7